jgi:hypothetical protein
MKFSQKQAQIFGFSGKIAKYFPEKYTLYATFADIALPARKKWLQILRKRYKMY